MRALAALLLLLAACGAPAPCAPGQGRLEGGACVPVDTGSAAGAGPRPGARDSGGVRGDTAEPASPWDPADIEAALGETLAAGPPTPPALRAAWIGVFAGAGAGCPGSGYDFTRGVEGCESPAGWVYTGPAEFDEVQSSTAARWSLEADSTALRPDGTRLVAAGGASWARQVRTDGGVELRGALVGTFSDSGADGWLGRGTSARWSYTGSTRADGVLDLTLDGGWTPHGGAAVLLTALHVDDCPGPTGVVEVRRAADGRWARVAFDCDPCGAATFAGAEVGRVCLDPAVLSAHLLRLGAL